MKKILCALAVLLALSAPFAVAGSPSRPGNYAAADVAGILDSETISYIAGQNDTLLHDNGGEVLFYTFRGTPPGVPIDQYAHDVFNRWEVGSAENNNGILVMICMLFDRDYHMVVGEGLSAHMTAARINEYFSNYFAEHFEAGDYNAAVLNLFDALVRRIYDVFGVQEGPAPAVAPAPITAPTPVYQPTQTNWWPALIVFLVILVIILVVSSRRRAPMGGGPMGGPMMPRRRMGGGGFWKGMFIGSAMANRRNRGGWGGGMGGMGRPPSGGGFTRGGSTGATRPPSTPTRPGGGFTRGGYTRGGGGGYGGGGMGRRR